MIYKAGLDVRNRPLLLKILSELHAARRPRIILGLRKHDAVPDWITHILLAQRDSILAGTKEEMKEHLSRNMGEEQLIEPGKGLFAPAESVRPRASGKALVEMRKLSVTYADRKVCAIRDLFLAHNN